MSLWNTINKLCRDLPEGYIVKLGMENGAAWVEAYFHDDEIDLPDSTDKNLQQELIDALIECDHHRQRGKATSFSAKS
jgi:hypothetical protein